MNTELFSYQASVFITVCTCVCICVYLRVHLCVPACAFVCTCVCFCVYLRVHLCVPACAFVPACACVCTMRAIVALTLSLFFPLPLSRLPPNSAVQLRSPALETQRGARHPRPTSATQRSASRRRTSTATAPPSMRRLFNIPHRSHRSTGSSYSSSTCSRSTPGAARPCCHHECFGVRCRRRGPFEQHQVGHLT